MENYSLSHLRALEAEAIHIIREVAAEFSNPVMLYSIGKDSSVMVRLAEKAFAEGKTEDVAYFEPFYLKDFVVGTAKKSLLERVMK